MTFTGEQILLRIYLQSADRAPHEPTFARILIAARNEHLAGATVLRGILGAGYHGLLKSSPWSLAEHLPIILEIVDTPAKITAFIEGPLQSLMIGGMMTLERASVILRRHRDQKSSPPTTPTALSTPLPPPSTAEPLPILPDLQPGPNMTINQNGLLLRIFIGDSDTHQREPLHRAIVQKARELGLAGATVLRGEQGFGAHSIVHTTHLLEMSTDLPIVIEIVDTHEKINLLLPHLESMVQEGMITLENVAILMYRHAPPAP